MPPVRTSRVPAPLAVEGWYMVQLLRLVRAVSAALRAELLPILAELAAEERMDAGDKPVPIRVLRGLDKLKVKARQTAEGFPAAEVVAQAANKVEVINSTGIGQVARELGLSVQPLKGAAKLQAARDRFMAENTGLIKNIPEDMRERIEQKVRKGVESGKRWETIAKDLQGEQGIGERRARLIARDQVNKYNGALTEARMTKLGITHYRWQGAMDQRERPTHVALQGLVFAWDKPPPEGHPGHPIQCRCVAIPVVSDKEKREAKDMTAEQLKARTAAVTAEKGGPSKKASKAAPAKKAEPAKAAAAKPVKAAPAAKATAAKEPTAAPVKATTAAQTQAKPAAAAAQAAPAQAQAGPAATVARATPLPPVVEQLPDGMKDPSSLYPGPTPVDWQYPMPPGPKTDFSHPAITVRQGDRESATVQTHLRAAELLPAGVLNAIKSAGVEIGIGDCTLADTPTFAAVIARFLTPLGAGVVTAYRNKLAKYAGDFMPGGPIIGVGNGYPFESVSVIDHEIAHALDRLVWGKASDTAEWATIYGRWTASDMKAARRHFPYSFSGLAGEHGKAELLAELTARYFKTPAWLIAVDKPAFDFIERKLQAMLAR